MDGKGCIVEIPWFSTTFEETLITNAVIVKGVISVSVNLRLKVDLMNTHCFEYFYIGSVNASYDHERNTDNTQAFSVHDHRDPTTSRCVKMKEKLGFQYLSKITVHF